MRAAQPGSNQGRCTCGRLLDECAQSVMRTRQGVFRFTRCRCGREWTEKLSDCDWDLPVSADEVLEAHHLLKTWAGSLADLVGPPSTPGT